MSDTSQAAVKRVRRDSPTVDAVCRQLERRVDADERTLVVDFAEIFLSKATPDFLHERSTDALAHLVLGVLRFLQRSRPGRVDVEVFNPDVDNEGWYAPVTVIRTHLSERPFIVDTIREFLHAQELPIEHNVYPVLHVGRDDSGAVSEVRPSREGERRESLVHCEVARVADEETRGYLQAKLQHRLSDVVRATDDFQAMRSAVDEAVGEMDACAAALPERRSEIEEVQAFLRWLRDGAFVFLGYRGYDLVEAEGGRAVRVEPDSGLGILRDESASAFARPVALTTLPDDMRALVEGGPLLIISKTNAESTVHRRARMDYIGVKKLSAEGGVVGEYRFIGLFTSKAFSEEAERIPILRQKLQQILEDAGAAEGSHDYKEINTIFNSMPKEELFLTSAAEIGLDVQTVLTTYHSNEVRVTLRGDPLRRGASVMVILPKDKFSGEVRRQIEKALQQAFQGEVLNYHLAMGEGDQARLHFYMTATPERLDHVGVGPLEATLTELIRSWQDRVREGLERVRPPDEARRLARRYGEAFSPEYQAATAPGTAVQDVLELEAMGADGRIVAVAFANPEASPAAPGGDRVTELKLYLRGERMVLSEFMPILESCGLKVIAVNPFDVEGSGVDRAIIYTFAVQDPNGEPLDIESRGSLLGQAILAARAGDATSDSLNSLVLSAGLHWREVDVLRAYAGYAFQLRAVPSRLSLPGALAKHPELARTLFDWFRARFDPALGAGVEERREAVDALRGAYVRTLAGVELLADDRALRRMAVLMDATLRTNWFRHGGRSPTRRSGGVPYVSLKFDARRLESIQRTRLRFEVYVRSSRMEGVHLRGAAVARGGIRWSDRPDDFRTEVLGLVKTQIVKNAVIVPGGSKGGFVAARLPADPRARAEEGKEQYRTLVRGLLDVTDNLGAGGEVVPPENVVCWDEPDPYLVVAADKGTATFSDVANGVAAEYGFWLGDAFASGGSHGYDHKVVGITARGAWECVKRHFREKGKDIQEEPFTVVGIGDMSGDVFGNGMLLSRQIRLLAAFDHRHVFVDPDPDPETSYQERERLFALGSSSWTDYDRSLLSPGGTIVPRGAKEVTLSPEAQRALGLEITEPIDGETLVRAVLRAPAELLWNGGIGTYVKASFETHSDVGDASNDALRIDADELRCQVVGEGGNLGLTQAARIQYALVGGRLNTDALDNSAGVALSDREVNLKILLGPAVHAGDLGEDRRNALLEALTDDVAGLVLQDSWSQSLAVSLDELRVEELLDEFRDLMTGLEREGVLDRAAEGLPSMEGLVERAESGGSLTRPELCVLLAYAKLSVKANLRRGRLPDDPVLSSYLMGYFPAAAVKEAGAIHLAQHRLRREIIASQVSNDLVDLMGATFVHRLGRDTGHATEEVVRAWVVASRLAAHRELLRELASPGRALRTDDAYRWLLGLGRVLERTTRWILQAVSPDVPTGEVISANESGLLTLRRHFHEIVAGADRDAFQIRVDELVEMGAERPFARQLITLRFLDQLLEILRVAHDTGADALETGRAFYRISELLSVSWLREAIFQAAQIDRWEQRAAQALADDLSRAHHRLVAQVMRSGGAGPDVGETALRLLEHRQRELDRYRRLLDEIRGEGRMTLSGLSVAVREMSLFAERTATV
jgi:glutamate dehydrogenase